MLFVGIFARYIWSFMGKTSFIHRYSYRLASLLFGSFFVLGVIFPNIWWSTHWLAFGDPVMRLAWLALGLLLLCYPWYSKSGLTLPGFFEKAASHRWYIPATALAIGMLMYLFPMVSDFYGDAIKLQGFLDKHIDSIPDGTHDSFFTLSVSPWAGHQRVLSIVTYITWLGGISYREAFVLLDSLCAALFVGIWLQFVHRVFEKANWRIMLSLTGLASPFMLIFQGHFESYAPVFVFLLLFTSQLYFYLQKPSGRRLGLVILLFLLSLQFHTVIILFLPTLLLAVVRKQFPESNLASRLMSWKGIGLMILLPVFLAGLILYVFVFEDYKDQRSLMEMTMAFDHLFLPILSPPAPLDSYNLFSINHLFDFFAEILLWSPFGLLLLLVVLVVGRKRTNWNSLPLQVLGLSTLLFVAFFFMLNPLLSMQMDWDLMAIPAVPFLMFVVVLVKENAELLSANKLLPMSIGLSLLCLPAFFLHHNQQMLSHRLEALGIRIYHSYYEWASTYMQHGLDIRTFESREAYEAYKLDLLNKLEKHARPGIDYELARFHKHDGQYYLRKMNQPEKAMPWLEKAHYFYPKGQNETLYLMEARFLLQQYDEAYALSRSLIEIEYPSREKSLSIAVECAVRAKRYEDALVHSNAYLELAPENATIQTIKNRILAGETDELENVFESARKQ